MLRLPDVLKEPMRLYREADAPLPREYTTWHQKLAELDLRRRISGILKQSDFHGVTHIDHNPWILLSDHDVVCDGWGIDGFRVKQVVVAINHGEKLKNNCENWKSEDWRVHTLRWHESGAWFDELDANCGAVRFAEILSTVEADVRATLPKNWTEEKILESMLRRA